VTAVAAKCDRCSGIFSDTDPYFNKPKAACKTCGTDAHWERGSDINVWALNTPPETEYTLTLTRTGKVRFRFVGRRGYLNSARNEWWIGFGNGPDRRTQHQRVVQRVARTVAGICVIELVIGSAFQRFTVRQEVSIEFDTTGADGFRDVDGSWCSAYELLNGNARNYGRKRVGTREIRDGEDTEAGTVAWRDLGGEAEKIDFLRAGGWHVRKEGSTGRPVGRPAKGILDKDKLMDAIYTAVQRDTERVARINEIAFLVLMSSPQRWTRTLLRAFNNELYAVIPSIPNVNTRTLAELCGITRRAAQYLASPNRLIGEGETRLTLQMIDLRLKRIENLLEGNRVALEESSAQVFQTLYAFRFGETPAEAWGRVLDESESGEP
jgi:hypothetical protein